MSAMAAARAATSGAVGITSRKNGAAPTSKPVAEPMWPTCTSEL